MACQKLATQSDIKSAYRKLARQNHPDTNQGDVKAEERFKEIQSAYQLLSDEDKRIQFDVGRLTLTAIQHSVLVDLADNVVVVVLAVMALAVQIS